MAVIRKYARTTLYAIVKSDRFAPAFAHIARRGKENAVFFPICSVNGIYFVIKKLVFKLILCRVRISGEKLNCCAEVRRAIEYHLGIIADRRTANKPVISSKIGTMTDLLRFNAFVIFEASFFQDMRIVQKDSRGQAHRFPFESLPLSHLKEFAR